MARSTLREKRKNTRVWKQYRGLFAVIATRMKVKNASKKRFALFALISLFNSLSCFEITPSRFCSLAIPLREIKALIASFVTITVYQITVN